MNNNIIAPIETASTASKLYNIDELFIYNDQLYKVTDTIAANANIIPDTNCEVVSVIDCINTKADSPLVVYVSKDGNTINCDTDSSDIYNAVKQNRQIICLTDRASSFSTPNSNTFIYKLDSFYTSNNEVAGVQFINVFITTINNANYFVKSYLTFQGNAAPQWGDNFSLIPTKTSQLTNDSDFYIKPSGGIPASDIASGVIPAIPVTDVQIGGNSIISNGVATIPVRSNVVSSSTDLVTSGGINNALSGILNLDTSTIKTGTAGNRAISPSNQHAAAFYGLAKAAGDTTQASRANELGTYTESAKTAIRGMLGIDGSAALVEEVTGTTPTITALPNVRYNCSEVSTISITPPANGTCDVFFTSGSTATVLTVPNTVKWPAWFDATALETDMIYEIMITDGVYGSVMTWES